MRNGRSGKSSGPAGFKDSVYYGKRRGVERVPTKFRLILS
jgi:hypothetical protein